MKIKKKMGYMITINLLMILYSFILIILAELNPLLWMIGVLIQSIGLYYLFIYIIFLLVFRLEFHSIQLNKDALLYLELKDYEKGIKKIEQAVSLFPENYEAWLNLGKINYVINHIDKALNYINKVIQLNPTKNEAWKLLGVIYYEMRDFDKSYDAYSHAIKIDPNDSYTWENFAKTLLALGRESEAIEAYNHYKELLLNEMDNHS